ncbi:hypothetical protein [Phaeocystidibacter luteus]|uniref:Uncharacterized protein n=1 Tax=Phaeocystidibacter luteus TaxID=911197 RepID=A0A6N6RG39_9FLAO|nr:hypothetical protein [Phaeocystidibacter luteus]KAB2807339.1 hypothetical protein F8C67_12230 [Phaeocystidibacter luteus]
MRYILSAILLFSFLFAGAVQHNSSDNDSPRLVKMLVGEKNIYALNSSGQVFIWDLENLTKTFASDTTIRYSSIAKDNSNNIYIGTNDGRIFIIDVNDYSFDEYLELEEDYYVYDIFFNSANELFLIIPYAIYDPIKDEAWYDFKHPPSGRITKRRFLFFFWKETDVYFTLPQYSFIDSQDRIWMTKSFGEFGGTLQIFDTRTRSELDANLDSVRFTGLFPLSVFEDDNQNIYITSGLQHFLNTGEIYSVRDNVATLVFDSDDFKDTTRTTHSDRGIFVGPGAYNHNDNKMYFATTNGFYRSTIPNDGRIKEIELLFKPDLLWDRESLAIGVSMSVKRIEFTEDNRLIFLTSNNGIGVYDGEELVMLHEHSN